MKLTNHKVLLTGATSGIGLELAKKLLSQNNIVIGTGRNTEQLNEFQRSYPNFVPFEADLSEIDGVMRLADFIKTSHKDINILINNAGVMLYYKFADNMADFRAIETEITTNLTSPVQLTSLLLPVISQNPFPTIVNVSSALGIFAIKESAVYCATKAGLHLFTRSLRKQLKDVKVVEVLPTKTDTPMSEGKGSEKMAVSEVVRQIIKGLENDQEEINIGKLGLLRNIARLNSNLAEKIVQSKQRE